MTNSKFLLAASAAALLFACAKKAEDATAAAAPEPAAENVAAEPASTELVAENAKARADRIGDGHRRPQPGEQQRALFRQRQRRLLQSGRGLRRRHRPEHRRRRSFGLPARRRDDHGDARR